MKTLSTPMIRLRARAIALACATILGLTARAAEAPATAVPALKLTPAERSDRAADERLLGSAWAGPRMVAVGDHGVILLSDDQGKTYRQAQVVPAGVTLTSVAFADTRTGWAVGHWGVILKTEDGGEHWTLQRSDTAVDQPLFSVYFRNAGEGWAVGLWSLMLHTTDGGRHWDTVSLPPLPSGKKADKSLYAVFGDKQGGLFVACEQGRVLRSLDGGKTWSYAETGQSATLWAGVALHDGSLLVAGLGGKVFRSDDAGAHWAASHFPASNSITALVETPGHAVLAAGLGGISLRSDDGGRTFSAMSVTGHASLTSMLAGGEATQWFSTDGPVKR